MIAEQPINQWGQIVAKAWQDEKFKNRLLAEPAVVFKEFGIQVPAGVHIRVVENTDQIVHLTLSAKPREGELSDAELEGVAGGGKWFDFIARFDAFQNNLSPKEAEQTKGSYSPQDQGRIEAGQGYPPS